MKINKLLIVSVIFLILAGTFFFLSRYEINKFNFTTVRIPIAIEAENTIKREFTSGVEQTYWVAIEARETIPEKELRDLLGMYFLWEDKGYAGPVLDISWEVYRGNALIASDRINSASDDGYTGGPEPRMGKNLGKFQGEAYTEYRLKVTVHNTIPKLDETNPEIYVKLDPWTINDAVVSSQLSFAASMFFLLISILLAAIHFIIYVVKKCHITKQCSGPKTGPL